MKANPIVWFEIYVKDMERAKRFYESVFETKLDKSDTPLAGLELIGVARSKQQRLQAAAERNAGIAGNHRRQPRARWCRREHVAVAVYHVHAGSVMRRNTRRR